MGNCVSNQPKKLPVATKEWDEKDALVSGESPLKAGFAEDNPENVFTNKEFEGTELVCEHCGRSQNSGHGASCENCHHSLPVPLTKQADVYRRPDKDIWASEAGLQLQKGVFWVRARYLAHLEEIEAEKATEELLPEVKHFIFECCYQPLTGQHTQSRWVLCLSGDALVALDENLSHHKKHVYDKDNTPEALLIPHHKSKKRHTVSLRRLSVSFSESTKEFEKPSTKPKPFEGADPTIIGDAVSAEEQLKRVRLWMKHVIDSASSHNKFGSSDSVNPIFSTHFGKVFHVSEHVKELKKAAGLH
mmetsp:Transcript_32252/g.69694  ORF Transcript_32252/g.69694 Transcript_32252/m.69694 type:complete len:303 (-) Transcript_32252:52-960(-)